VLSHWQASEPSAVHSFRWLLRSAFNIPLRPRAIRGQRGEGLGVDLDRLVTDLRIGRLEPLRFGGSVDDFLKDGGAVETPRRIEFG
jgi:hypothetical protein